LWFTQNEETAALAEEKSPHYANGLQLCQATSVPICNNSSFQLQISLEKRSSVIPDSIVDRIEKRCPTG